MVRVYMTNQALPILIRTARGGDAVVHGETDTLKVTDRKSNVVFLFRWSAVDYVEGPEDE